MGKGGWDRVGRVARKAYSVILVAWLIFALGLVMPIRPATAQEPYIKVYVDQPLGYIPFVAPGGKVTIDIMIETSGIADGTAGGIVGWGINIQVDPNVLDINLTAPPPPPFPPPPPPATVIGAEAGYFLFEYGLWYGITPTLMAGNSDPLTGYWKDLAETFIPNPGHGAGDYVCENVTNKLVTLEVTSKSDTQPCLIDLVSGFYKTGEPAPDNVYPVDTLLDGYYGPQPPHAEFTYTPSAPRVGDTVTFNASASYDPDGGDLVSYAWDFGDETTGTGNITTYAYADAGIYTVTLNVTDDEGLWATGSQNITIYGPPVASFTLLPSQPAVGEPVTFNASASSDPDGGTIVSYDWDFGDGVTLAEADPITTHIYTLDANYTVTLSVTDDEEETNATTDEVTVSRAMRSLLDVTMDVGSIYFSGELAEFYVGTSFIGEPVDAEVTATVYYSNGTVHEDLSGFVERIVAGVYRVPYPIPLNAANGTYVLVVNASFSTARGFSLKAFLISETLTGTIAEITGDIATIVIPNLRTIKANLTAINATLVRIDGTTAMINSTIGKFETPATTICATLTEINGTITTINSTLGLISGDIGDINGNITNIDGTLVEIQTSIGLIETNVTAINAKLTAINETVAIVSTDLLGSIEVELVKINATIADVHDGLLTINTTLGAIQDDVDAVKDYISVELVSVTGDIKEGLANVTAAVTDAAGNILLELGQVEVRLADINATLVDVEGTSVTLKTDIGSINGTITSIQGNIATIETDIGVVEAGPTSFAIVAEILEEWPGARTSLITTPAGTFDTRLFTNSTLEGPATFSDNTLTIIVTGQTGTTGMMKVMLPKQLLLGIGSQMETVAVTINGRQVSFTYTEEAQTYLVEIVYTHSRQTIKVHLAGSQLSPLLLWALAAVAVVIAFTTMMIGLRVRRVRKKPIKP